MTPARPSLDACEALLREHPNGNLISVYRDVKGDLETPVSAFMKVRQGQHSFLLESVEGGERIARYSFIGTNPYKVLTQNGTDPLCAVESELSQFSSIPVPGLPSFTGGAVGYIGYECVQYFEPTVSFDGQSDPLELPESLFMMCDELVVFDHVKHTCKVVAHVHVPTPESRTSGALADAYTQACARIAAIVQRLNTSLSSECPYSKRQVDPSLSREDKTVVNVGPDGYTDMVANLKEHIVNGDIIQAVPAQRVARQLDNVHALDVYRQLRVINPSPYMFFLDCGAFQVVGASPELLVKVEDGRIFNNPIAGTRRRGATPEEDQALAEELLADEKERAEHTMLVDLGRNDVGRVSEPGTVKVDSLMQVEYYSHVMHIVSRVSGRLKPSMSMYDAFRSIFPAGTVSGAPKIRAMQLVSGLEKDMRRFYAGSVGWMSFSGEMDTCIAIRTMVVKDHVAYLQAGGGIVYDSDPALEREESLNKMMALARAVDAAEEQAQAEMEEKQRTGEDRPGVYDPVHLDSVQSTFGKFGGSYVSETLMEPLAALEKAYMKAMADPTFHQELKDLHAKYVGRPTPLYECLRLSEHLGGARVWLKREDLAHTGAHKINNALPMALLAKRMGKKRIVAETGAGQHGVATATACALLGLQCNVYMGEEDMRRQSLNVFRMNLLGAKVLPVLSGSRTLKDAVNESMRDWVSNVESTFLLIGSAVGPHPYPTIVRDFQSVIGKECRKQMLQQASVLPDVVVACVGGGSNSIGIFHPFLEDSNVKLVGVEAAGHGVASGKHAATLGGGSPGVLHGSRTFMIQDDDGQVVETHSISAGLDYPGVGPEHSHLMTSGRATYSSVTDKEALEGMKLLTRLEGIIPALESSHAVYHACELAKTMSPTENVVVCLSGRGDKDMPQVAKLLAEEVSLQ